MYKWLAACVVSTVVATGGLSVAWWATCTWYISPKVIALEQKETESCRNSGERAVATLTGLLATLLGVAGQFDRKE